MNPDTLKILSRFFRERSTEYLKFELRELESLFGMLLYSSLVGYPAPPTFLTLRLLPHLEGELRAMVDRLYREDDLFGELTGLFDIG